MSKSVFVSKESKTSLAKPKLHDTNIIYHKYALIGTTEQYFIITSYSATNSTASHNYVQ